MEQLKAIGASWARSFLAAALATYLAVGLDWKTILTSAVSASAPVLIRWLNPNDTAFGQR